MQPLHVTASVVHYTRAITLMRKPLSLNNCTLCVFHSIQAARVHNERRSQPRENFNSPHLKHKCAPDAKACKLTCVPSMQTPQLSTYGSLRPGFLHGGLTHNGITLGLLGLIPGRVRHWNLGLLRWCHVFLLQDAQHIVRLQLLAVRVHEK